MKLPKPDKRPSSNFKDDHERRLAQESRSRDIKEVCLALIALVKLLAPHLWPH